MWALLTALGAVAGATSVASGGDHPAVKIIALLDKLVAQVKTEAAAETANFAEFTMWCSELKKEKTKEREEVNDELETALALVQSLTDDIAKLNEGIAKNTAEIGDANTAKTQASNDRATTNTAYLAAKGDLESTIQSIESAISSLEATDPGSLIGVKHQVEKAAALVEVFEPSKAAVVRRFLQGKAFLQKEDPMDAQTSIARAQGGGERQYDFKSGGVIEILKQLQLKFEDELEDANKAETASLNAWKLVDATLQDQIDAGDTAKTTKESLVSRKGQELSQAEADRDDADYAKRAAERVLELTESTCSTRKSEFDERSARREGEIAAMKQAQEVLSKVTGVRKPSDKLETTSFSFVQKKDERVAQVVNLLRTASKKVAAKFLHKKAGSQAKDLAKLADSIAKLEGKAMNPSIFFEIKSMIESMVNHLLSEQRDEDTHKNWCDKETLKSETMESNHETKRDELVADINLLESEIDTLTNAVTTNTGNIASLQEEIEAQTKTRTDAKAENKATMEDAQKAQTAVQQAIAVLEDFYKGIGGVEKDSWDAGEFVQLKAVRRAADPPKKLLHKDTEAYMKTAPKAMRNSLGSYSGTSGGTSVIGLLEDVAADFAAMEAQAATDETTQSDDFADWLKTSNEEKATLEHDNEVKTTRIDNLKTKLAAKNGDLKHTKSELAATVKYLKSLEPPCEEGDSTYEERKASRTSEIEALKEAGKILAEAFD